MMEYDPASTGDRSVESSAPIGREIQHSVSQPKHELTLHLLVLEKPCIAPSAQLYTSDDLI